MSTTATPDRFTTLPDEHALQATVVALEIHQELPGRMHLVLIRSRSATEPPGQPDPPRHQEMAL